MKRLALISLSVLSMFSVAIGQPKKSENMQTKETRKEMKAERVPLKKLEGNKVSQIAKENFIVDFGTIPDVRWQRLGTFDEAIFKKNGKEMIANYDIDGKLVGTTQVVTYAEVPARGQQEISKRYKDYKVTTVIFYDDNEANDTDMIMYGIQFDDADNWFVELAKGTEKLVVKVDKEGEVTFFKQL